MTHRITFSFLCASVALVWSGHPAVGRADDCNPPSPQFSPDTPFGAPQGPTVVGRNCSLQLLVSDRFGLEFSTGVNVESLALAWEGGGTSLRAEKSEATVTRERDYGCFVSGHPGNSTIVEEYAHYALTPVEQPLPGRTEIRVEAPSEDAEPQVLAWFVTSGALDTSGCEEPIAPNPVSTCSPGADVCNAPADAGVNDGATSTEVDAAVADADGSVADPDGSAREATTTGSIPAAPTAGAVGEQESGCSVGAPFSLPSFFGVFFFLFRFLGHSARVGLRLDQAHKSVLDRRMRD